MSNKEMSKKRRKNRSRGIILKSIIIAICVVAIGIYYMFFTGMSRSGEETYLYIDSDDNVDSVYQKLSPITTKHSLLAFKQLARYKSYGDHIKTGRYQIGSHGALQTFRYVRNGIQAPVNVTINSVRTTERLAKDISKKLMMSRDELYKALNDSATCAEYDIHQRPSSRCLFLTHMTSIGTYP